MVADHLSRLENLKPDHVPLNGDFTYDKLAMLIDIEGMSYDHYHAYLKAQYSNVETVIEEEATLVHKTVLWYADYVNNLATKFLPPDITYQHNKRLFHDVKHFYWDEPLIFKRGADGLSRCCVLQEEIESIINHFDFSSYGGHASTSKTCAKILQAGIYWPTIWCDVHYMVVNCNRCQHTGNISKHDEIPLNNILEVDVFDVWGIYFMG